MKNSPAAPSSLPPEEWDFSPIPDTEAEACRLWEYLRESATVRAFVQHYRKHYAETRMWPVAELPPRLAPLRGALNGRIATLAVAEALHAYHEPPAAPRWPEPWQRISPRPAELRDLTPSVAPLKIGHWLSAREAELRSDLPGRFAPNNSRTVDSALFGCSVDRTGDNRKETALIRVENGDNLELVLRRFVGGSTHVFDINWLGARDSEIVAAFGAWVKRQRPADCPQPPRTGGRPTASPKEALEWLAHARWLSLGAPASTEMPTRWSKIPAREHYNRRNRALREFKRWMDLLDLPDEIPLFHRPAARGKQRR